MKTSDLANLAKGFHLTLSIEKIMRSNDLASTGSVKGHQKLIESHFFSFLGVEVVKADKEGEFTLQLSHENKLSSILAKTDELKRDAIIDDFWIKNIDLENLFLACSKD